MDAPIGNKLALAACLVLLGVFVAQGVMFLQNNSLTVDEVVAIGAGYSYLKTGDFRLNREHPPLMKELCALPVYLAHRLPFEPDPKLWEEAAADVESGAINAWPISIKFLYESPVAAERILTLARIPNLVLGTLLVALIGWWAYRLWGPGAAVVGTALAALEPNLVAHSCLATTDLGVTFFAFLSLYLLWEFLQRPRIGLLALAGASAGLAMMSKFSGVIVLGIDGALLGWWIIYIGCLPVRGGASGKAAGIGRRLVQACGLILVLMLAAGLVLLTVYFFQGIDTFLQGFRWLTGDQMRGRSAYFWGKYYDHGWWNYFLVAFLIKTPAGSLVLIAASLLFFRLGQRLQWREALFLLVPVAAFFVAATTSRTHIGLRYALPVYPFLFVMASRLATISFRKAWATPVMLGIPLAFTALSALRVTPHQLAYFNEVVGGPAEGPRYLSDSNIDWGQDLKNLKAYMDREGVPILYLSYFGVDRPEYHDIRYQYLPCGIPRELRPPSADLVPHDAGRELLAVSVVNLHGHYLEEDQQMFHWLRHRKPVARIGWSIHVYDITGDVEGHLHLAEAYRQAGLVQKAVQAGFFRRASHELEKVLVLNPDHEEAAFKLRDFFFIRHRRPVLQLAGLLASAPHGPLPCLPFLVLPGENAAR